MGVRHVQRGCLVCSWSHFTRMGCFSLSGWLKGFLTHHWQRHSSDMKAISTSVGSRRRYNWTVWGGFSSKPNTFKDFFVILDHLQIRSAIKDKNWYSIPPQRDEASRYVMCSCSTLSLVSAQELANGNHRGCQWSDLARFVVQEGDAIAAKCLLLPRSWRWDHKWDAQYV